MNGYWNGAAVALAALAAAAGIDDKQPELPREIRAGVVVIQAAAARDMTLSITAEKVTLATMPEGENASHRIAQDVRLLHGSTADASE